MAGEAARHSMVRGWPSWRSPTASPQPAPSSRRPSGASPTRCSNTRISLPSERSPTSPRRPAPGRPRSSDSPPSSASTASAPSSHRCKTTSPDSCAPPPSGSVELADRPQVERHRANADGQRRRDDRQRQPRGVRRGCRSAQRPAPARARARRGGRAAEWRCSSSTTLARFATRSTRSPATRSPCAVSSPSARRRLDTRRHRPAPLRALVARRRGVRRRARAHDRRLHRRAAVAVGDGGGALVHARGPVRRRRSTAKSARWRCSN